jgi:DNA repair exonuclease SbcCD ATPase subunit
MFRELELKNFRQHQALTVNFEVGVVALRGANEAGKTTLLEAIAYAMGGAVMLREPLAEVVTYGQKEGTLKVRLVFVINGVEYQITRSKSGAEIKSGPEILATGQSEVTKYVEKLIGCPIKQATQLMLANQQKLRGTLEEDGAAVKLIEQLADFAVIDKIVGLVQAKLPCGSTVSAEARITTLEQQLADPIADDTGPAQAALSAADNALVLASKAYTAAKEAYTTTQEPARQAQARLDAEKAAASAVVQARNRLMTAKATFDAIQPVPGPSEDEIEELRRQVTDANLWGRAVAAHKVFLTLPEPMWEGSLESLEAERNKLGQEVANSIQTAAGLRTNIAVLQGQRITQTACGLCGKDLSNVPEVVTKNSELDTSIAMLTGELSVANQVVQDKSEEHQQYVAVVNEHQRALRLYQSCSEFVTLSHDTVPPRATWTGPDITEAAPSNPLVQLQQAEQKVRQYQMDLGRQQQAQTALNLAQQAFWDAEAAEEAAKAAVGDAQTVLDSAAAATASLYEAEQTFREVDAAQKQAAQQLAHAQALYSERLRARTLVETQLKNAKTDLENMQFNNGLIESLRKARPSIVEELWNLVAASVSDTFSRIRGVPSTFLRQDDSFTVDGKGIKGLSGSTLDALGLAIRMSLTKTFLPNTRFMVLDEPAAAADDDRETNMLGVIAASEFEQVLLVTHSDLADSFASQVVRL